MESPLFSVWSPYSISDYRNTSLRDGQKGKRKYASEQLGAGTLSGALRVFDARNVIFGDCGGHQQEIRDQLYAAIRRSKRLGLSGP
jgi:hypothetical protein